MKLYIKNMVCRRCKMVVQAELEKLGLHTISVELGEVEIREEQLSEVEIEDIKARLLPYGFELLDDRRSQVIEKIKNLIIAKVHYSEVESNFNLSDIIASQLGLDYNYLSNLFSEIEGITIEKYFIHQKIEKVKELIMYDELSLSEIAFRLNYSSAAHLSNQFKKVTGFAPSYFKQLKQKKRTPIEEL